jgi:hypothetical protein
MEDFPRIDFLVDDAFLAYREAVVLAKVFSAKELSDALIALAGKVADHTVSAVLVLNPPPSSLCKVRHKLGDDLKR